MRAVLAILLAGAVAGCGPTGPVLPASTVAFAGAPAAYRLGAGDVVRLSLFGEPNFQGEFRVGADGNLSLPLIDTVRADNLTIEEVRQSVQRALANGYYDDPRVSAEITTYRPFYILGEVQRPGAYPYVPGMTLAQAIATAGGPSYRASSRVVAIDTPESADEVIVVSNPAMPIGPNYTIRLLERTF